jgi:hypothetical protein
LRDDVAATAGDYARRMVTSHVVPNFLPSEDGLHFPNSYPSGPTVRIGPLDPRLIGVGDASMGLCGGMCFFVRRKFKANQPVPTQTTVPDNGSDLFKQLVREQVRSLRLGLVPVRFWRVSAMDEAARKKYTRDTAWPAIRRSLDGNSLTQIGLIRQTARNPFKLIGNHQVLAYGYEIGDDASIRVRIYDPNHPNRDNVWVPMDGSGPQSTGELLLGVAALD